MYNQKENSVADNVLYFSPQEFCASYTRFYETYSSDSPKQSRSFLENKLIHHLELRIATNNSLQPVRVLSVGAGKQIVESELESYKKWETIGPQVNLMTFDIATLRSSQLLSHGMHHVTADGSQVPFGNGSFDIIYSNMAIDFMPRKAFSEVSRVLKPDGVFLVNLHHPNLVTIARSHMEGTKREIDRCLKKLDFGKNSRSLGKYIERLKRAQAEKEDAKFILETFPKLIFHSPRAIETFFMEGFSFDSLHIEEHENRPYANGWFYDEAQRLQKR